MHLGLIRLVGRGWENREADGYEGRCGARLRSQECVIVLAGLIPGVEGRGAGVEGVEGVEQHELSGGRGTTSVGSLLWHSPSLSVVWISQLRA